MGEEAEEWAAQLGDQRQHGVEEVLGRRLGVRRDDGEAEALEDVRQ